MRGVPRDRPAISAEPGGIHLQVQQAGRAAQHQFQLLDRIELQVAGETEPVAQRTRQQSGAGGGADQREGRQFQRDGCGAGALAHDDVHAEVFHGHVQHFLGRPGHPVDLVEEEDLALGQRGQDGGQVARRAGSPGRC